MTRRYGSSVVQAVEILRALRAGRRGISDLARTCGLDKGNTSRLLSALLEVGLVEKEERGDAYGLGPGLVELGMAALRQFDLRERALPVLKALAQQTGETVHLAVPSGAEVIYLAKVESPGAIQMRSKVGDRMPIHSTGLGKALMPALEASALARILAVSIEPRTPNTVVDPEAVRREMRVTQQRGFAMDMEENEEGVRCVAAPIFDHEDRAIAAVSIAGPLFRMDAERMSELGREVADSAAEISTLMGHPTACEANPEGEPEGRTGKGEEVEFIRRNDET